MLIDKLEKSIAPILEAEGCELVDVEYKKEGKSFFLRIYIDRKEKGVTLDDCQNVSTQVGAILDVEEIISDNYVLEVSSPGVERPLKKITDFNRFIGKNIKIYLYKPLDGVKIINGSIKSVEGDIIVINEYGAGKLKKICHKDIAKANLTFDW